MSERDRTPSPRGPHRADQIRSGDPWELSNGHRIDCFPTGSQGGQANLVGGAVLDSDPDVDSSGVDVGCSPSPEMLRAPDVSVGNVPNQPGWAPEAPPLAVEYADRGQDEGVLKARIRDLFAAGTRFVWVVRLTGPRRVEVLEAGRSMRLFNPGDQLRAPGILKNPVPVEALYDRDAAHEATLRNLLQRRGYESLEAVQAVAKAEGRTEGKAEGRAEGKAEGKAEGQREAILVVLAARGLEISEKDRTILKASGDSAQLERWLRKASAATTTDEVFAD
ncbi:MAG: hypothetical protein V3T83_10100 [Acidobacteriota bacterium]